ncbi:MAG TPA: aldehyde dehydrogenase family protein [Candidatus Polarisedimenticolaceae bacterium]|nr:aldehyde dehydrogenase family protein [Candidatus Polarisedimenticolaceae bacterium]
MLPNEPLQEAVRDLSVRVSVAELTDRLGHAVLPTEASAPEDDERSLLCVNPVTGEAFARVACAGLQETEAAVEAASTALALWRGVPFRERVQRLRRLAEIVHKQASSIAGLIALEQGKPVLEALTLEVMPALDHLRYLVDHADRLYSLSEIEPRHPFYAHKRAHYLYDPIGIVALLTPYNLPFAVPLIRVGTALTMGNAVVLKPSESTPLCGLRIGELCLEAGFPPGLVGVLPMRREEAILLAAHPKVDKVFVTGTLETGQHVMSAAGCAPRPVVLSLSGKHPSIVADDADLDRAARGVVWGALANCGQNCGAIERVYVVESVAARFVGQVLGEVDRLRLGDPLNDEVDLGPLTSDSRRTEVHHQVSEAVSRGARLLRGGTLPEGPGFFYPPTVLLNPPADCRLMREETLGPVIPIVVVENLERALLLANDSEYALSASGWTGSPVTAERLMVGLQAGVVTVNDVLYSFGEPAASWSGYKRSGIGHVHGTAGLREMCRQRFVSYDPRPAEAPLLAFPYDGAARKLVEAGMTWIHGGSRMRRFRGLVRLLRSPRFRARMPRGFFTPWRQSPG